MAHEPYIDLEVANGTYRFALPTEAQMRIEGGRRATFGEIAARVMKGRFPLTETSSTGLVTEAAFAAFDLETIICEALVAGGWASLPDIPEYEMTRGDVDGWFRRMYLSTWTIEEKWTVAAAIIGAMFYGHPAATNLPKVPSNEDKAAEADAA